MDDHRKLYRRIFSIERFIRNLTRSFSTMCDSATASGGVLGGTASANGVDIGAAVAAAAAAAAAAAVAAEQSGAACCGGGAGGVGCGGGGHSAVGCTAVGGGVASSASALLAKRERRLRLEKVGSYRVGRTLGRGNFAQVRVAYHEVANTKVAMKIVDKRSLDEENLAKIEREIQILQQLDHPYIVRLYEVIRTKQYLYIVTEYVSNGELFDMLMDRGRQTEAESRRLFQQIVSAVAYCHAHGIVHRDLKAENLLLDKRGNIKIIDFGFSNYQQSGQLLSTWCGSPPYAAPELLLAQEYDGRQSDVWSLGVILYILVTAGFPFPGDSVDKLKRAVLSDHLKIPFWVSVECADLIRKMLIVQPSKRCTLQYIIQHKWLTCDMPEQVKQLLLLSPSTAAAPAEAVIPQHNHGASIGRGAQLQQQHQQQLDPTVLIFMQQHTGWSDDQIVEEVLSRNYESPVFSTYALLLSRLSDIREAEAVAAATAAAAAASGGSVLVENGVTTAPPPPPLISSGAGRTTIGGGGGSPTNLLLDNEYTRRGSRGSIISGRANVEPAEQQQHATIPAHHLAKLSLSTSPDYQGTDDSDSASDWSMVPSSAGAAPLADEDMGSSQFPSSTTAASSSSTAPQHHSPCATAAASSSSTSYYKSKRNRANRRGVAAARATPAAVQQQQNDQQQRMAYVALEQQYHQLNPLLNAAAQQFAVDTSRAAWANAAAAAALFASQLQQQHTGSTNGNDTTRQQLQQAAALNLVSLQNFPFVDYAARMMHVPTQERRASANEALLGLNSYAHLLAACSTMGSMVGGNGCFSAGTASSSSATTTTPIDPSSCTMMDQQHQQHSRCSSSQGTLSSSTSTNSPCRRQSVVVAGGVGGAVVVAPQVAACPRPTTVHQHRNNNNTTTSRTNPSTYHHASPSHHNHHHHHHHHHHSRRSVEEEGEFYLSGQRGSGKRNTVHSITAGQPILSTSVGSARQSPQPSAAFQRHTRTPYAKQGSSFGGGTAMGGAERRSSWASSSAGSAVLAINAQQHAQLERLYRQSVGQANPAVSGTPSSESSSAAAVVGLSSVQQLQHEFQKLCASTKDGSPTITTAAASVGAAGGGAGRSSAAHNRATNGATLFRDSTHRLTGTTSTTVSTATCGGGGAQQQQEQQHHQMLPRAAPTISITDEHNRPSLLGGATSLYDHQLYQQATADGDADMPMENQQFSQSLPHQRPATVCGFSSTCCSTSVQQQQQQAADDPAGQPKFVYIPVSIRTALERLQRVVDAHQLLCELQSDESSMGAEDVNAIRIRVAPHPMAATTPAAHDYRHHSSSPTAPLSATTTILELVLFRMDQSPNISRASFTHVQGANDQCEVLRQTLLRVFNEVL